MPWSTGTWGFSRSARPGTPRAPGTGEAGMRPAGPDCHRRVQVVEDPVRRGKGHQHVVVVVAQVHDRVREHPHVAGEGNERAQARRAQAEEALVRALANRCTFGDQHPLPSTGKGVLV
jgi:hypothetical protein